MNIIQRFRLLLKGQINAALDAIEDRERSLVQLVHDMEEELDAAKHAVARAMANEDRLRAQIEFQTKDAAEWQRAAERSLAKGNTKGNEADAREALRRTELAERQRGKLAQQLERQSTETEEVRQSVVRMQERCDQAKSQLQVIQAQMRQIEARKAIGGVLSSAHAHNLHGEFERISGRVEEEAATERNYQRLDDQLSGEDVRRRFEADAVADAVEERLARLRKTPEETGEPAAGGEAR